MTTYLKFILAFCFVAIACSYLTSQSLMTDTLYYDLGVSSLSENQKQRVTGWLSQINSESEIDIEITGYTDFVGSSSSNVELSIDRARLLADYCKELGIDHTHISINGVGEIDSTIVGNTSIGVPVHRMVVIKCSQVIGSQITKVADIKYSNLRVGNQLVLDELNFHPGKHYLISKSIPALKGLLKILIDNPSLEIEIQGHICCGANRVEPDGLDLSTGIMNLSTSRAENIYNFLVRNGINSDRLSYQGYGFTKPQILPEITPEDQQKNRRVELRIVSM